MGILPGLEMVMFFMRKKYNPNPERRHQNELYRSRLPYFNPGFSRILLASAGHITKRLIIIKFQSKSAKKPESNPQKLPTHLLQHKGPVKT